MSGDGRPMAAHLTIGPAVALGLTVGMLALVVVHPLLFSGGSPPPRPLRLLVMAGSRPSSVCAGEFCGNLVGFTSPVGAAIAVNNQPDGASNAVSGWYNLSLPPGEYSVSFSAPGFQPWNDSVRIVSGGTVELNATLASAPPAPASSSGPSLSWDTLRIGLALDAGVVGGLALVFAIAHRAGRGPPAPPRP